MADLTLYLRKAGIEFRDRGTNVAANNINICCPMCGEVRFHCGINRDELWYYCWVCGSGGPWGRLAARLQRTHPSVNWRELKPDADQHYISEEAKKPEKPEEKLFVDLTDKDTDVWNWLTEKPALEDLEWKFRPRGMKKEILQDSGIKLGIGRLSGYVVFEQSGSVVARCYSEHAHGPRWWKRLKESPFLFGAGWVSKVQPEVGFITEGIFDNLRLPIGTAVSILGTVTSEALVNKIATAFQNTRKLVLALDKGANEDQLIRLHLMLRDCGYEIEIPDWSKIKIPGVKDLDELYIARGENAVFEFVGLTQPEILL